MMDKLKRVRQAKHELTNPHDSEQVQAVAEVLAEIERAQRAAVMDQRDTLDLDPADGVERIDKDRRKAEMVDLVDAYTPGGQSLVDVWLDKCAPADLDAEDPTQLAHYVEMSGEEWEQQISRWADTYRAQAGGSLDATDRDLADLHVEGQWGVTLDRFEMEVVQWDRRQALRDLLAAPSEATEQAIEANTEVLA
ncbi:hypothetical protein QA599_17210 [Haloarculaceae archaeon H-GB1-1]|nr:hypothetical protein [Haloarculaceae archaeon H-GB1-1]